MSDRITAALRLFVEQRANSRCEYCLVHGVTEHLLKLNLPESVELRKLLSFAGRYPGKTIETGSL